jgi:DNA mismatch endonuclease (patch repair protein)
MRKLLRKTRIKFKRYPKIVGNPDFLVGDKIALFCDSSFWHGRNWMKLKAQLQRGSNPSYWVTHIARNRQRDKKVNRLLMKQGYSVVRFWEDDILKRPDNCVTRLRTALSATAQSD